MLASAAGTLLAASLIYSGHSTNEGRIIHNDRFDDATLVTRGLKQCFESPDSPYFLESRDIRSNVSAGGGIIPLMGTQQAPITPLEMNILGQHKLAILGDMQNDMARSATHLGRVFGPELDLIIGIDYGEDARTRAPVLYEVNFGPAPTTYNKCWLGGQASRTEANYEQRMKALDSVARFSPRRLDN